MYIKGSDTLLIVRETFFFFIDEHIYIYVYIYENTVTKFFCLIKIETLQVFLKLNASNTFCEYL